MKTLIFFFIVTFSLKVGAQNLALENILTQARQSMHEGYPEKAVTVLTEILNAHPHAIEARSLRALALGSLGQEDRAIVDYERILEEREDKDAHYHLGMLLAFRKKETRHALEHLDRYLSLEKDPQKSRKAAQVMKSLDPIFVSDLERKAVKDSQQELSDGLNDRKVTLDRLLKWNPFSVEALVLAAQILQRDGSLARAETLCRRSLELHPTCGPCHETLAEILKQRGRTPESEPHFRKAELFEGKL